MLPYLTATYKQMFIIEIQRHQCKTDSSRARFYILFNHTTKQKYTLTHSVKEFLMVLHVGCSKHFFTCWLEKTKTKAAPAAVRPQVNRVPTRAWTTGLCPSNMVPDLTKQKYKFTPERNVQKKQFLQKSNSFKSLELGKVQDALVCLSGVVLAVRFETICLRVKHPGQVPLYERHYVSMLLYILILMYRLHQVIRRDVSK